MKRAILLVLLPMLYAAGLAENVRFKQFGTPIPARADLDVRWNAPVNALPPKIWVYRLLPRKLSPKMISFLMTRCSFTDKDRMESNINGMSFKTSDNSRRLRVSFPSGVIDYQTVPKYSATNLIKDVPNERQALKRTKDFLSKLDISLADIDKQENSNNPRLISFDTDILYFVNSKTITNTISRTVRFRRAVDGFSFLGAGTGSDCQIDFGDHGKIIKIDLSWRNMERNKSFLTVTPEKMIKSLREGKAIQGLLPMNSRGIDWRKAKSVTINQARPCYYAGNRMQPSDWLEPFAVLDTVVDTGHGNIRVEIDCPIYEDTSP